MNNTTDATSGASSAGHSAASEVVPDVNKVRVSQSRVFCVVSSCMAIVLRPSSKYGL